MNPLDLLSYFFGGVFSMNAIPHSVAAMMGRKFPSPFAKPPGTGLSSPAINVIWGFINLVVAYVLILCVGQFDLRDSAHAAALGLGMLLMALAVAAHFGSLNGGRGPDGA